MADPTTKELVILDKPIGPDGHRLQCIVTAATFDAGEPTEREGAGVQFVLLTPKGAQLPLTPDTFRALLAV